jgi:hypothetical protein
VAKVPARMIRRRRALVPVSAIAIAAVGSGCGSSKQQVSAAELVQKADAICRDEQAKFNQIQAHPPANASIASDQTNELIDVTSAASSDLRDLEPPGQLSAPYDAYLQARDDAVDQMKRGQDSAENQDSSGYSAAQTAVARSAARRHKLAAAVGLQVCGSNPSSG